MRKQRTRTRATDDGGGCSRRGFLRAAALGSVAGVTGLAGCPSGVSSGREGSGDADGDTDTDGGAGTSSTPVTVLAAGSLQHALETGLEPAIDVPVRVEAHGSATVARMVDEGQRDPDIVAVADTALFEKPLSPPWHSVFTSNAVVLAYNPDTEGGQRIAEANADADAEAGAGEGAGPERWYEPLLDGDVRLGRTDPDQDPLGYRALFALELASRYYDDAPALHERIPRREQVYPETGLISQFETGAVDAALAYRNMAVERDYAYVDLPDQIDLSDPAYAEDWYDTVSYELPTGQVVRGDTIGYGATIRKLSEAAVSVFDVLTTGEYLEESGFLLGEGFPRYEGDVPEAVRRATGASADGVSKITGPT
jgi:molybdate/tungstate transport system substrate-binding protein